MRETTVSVVADRGGSNEDFVGAVAWYAHRLGDFLLPLVHEGVDGGPSW